MKNLLKFLIKKLLFLSLVTGSAIAEEYDALFGSWEGVKPALEDKGLTIETSIIADILSLVSGGVDRGTAEIFTYNLAGELDTEKAGLWDNGTFVLSVFGINGAPLYNRVGDIQVSSNIDGMGVDTFSIYEGFYEHSFLDDKASFLFGLVDYNSEFYVLDYGLILMHSSFGYGIDVSQAANSTYPLTGLTGRLRVEPTDDSYFMFSMSDAVPGDPDNYNGTHVQLRTSDGIFYAAEYGLTSTEEDSITNYYKVALGGWYRTTDFEDYAGNQRNNTGGVYLIGEKQLTHEADPTQGLGAFAQIGFAEPNKNLIGQYFGAGLHYTGLIPGRDSDITALGVAHARHGNSYMNATPGSLRAETAIEFSYSAPIGYGIRLQPDIQYIVNPGTDSSIDNALVIGSRIEVVF